MSIMIAAPLLAGTAAAAGATAPSGHLAGDTEISIGCPAERPGSSCKPTRPLPNAHFSIVKSTASGQPGPHARIVAANAQALFSIALPAGRYLITPLAQSGTPEGPKLALRIRAGHTTHIVVGFRSSHPIA